MKRRLSAKGLAAIRAGVRRRMARVRAEKRGGQSVNGNGHPDMDTLRQHGIKYLAARREVLLSQVDSIDAALKAMD